MSEIFELEDMVARFVDNMIARGNGPMHLRVLLQPVTASIFAILAGLKDAKAGKPVYFWALFTNPDHRRGMLKDGWMSVGKVFILAMVLDVVYQIIVQHWVFPGEVIITAILLAIVPYLILRGAVNRIASLRS